MPKVLRVRNWDTFQHYKDRAPLWIKVYGVLLDDADFLALPEAAQGQLLKVWLLASRRDNRIPGDPQILRGLLGVKGRLYLKELIEAGFLLEGAPTREREWNYANRAVSRENREEVMAASGGQCAACGTTESLEIDHIVPVSRGGTNERENLQVLCRPCNRRKRSKTDDEWRSKIGAKSEQNRSAVVADSEQTSTLSRGRPRVRGELELERETTPTTTAHAHASAENGDAAAAWTDPQRHALQRFREAMPPERWAEWRSTLLAWREGMGYQQGRAAHPDDIAAGLVEYLTNTPPDRRDFTARHVLAYVVSAERRRQKGERAPVSKPSQFEVALAAAEAVQAAARGAP